MLLTFPAKALEEVTSRKKYRTLRLTAFPGRFRSHKGQLLTLQFGSYSKPVAVHHARLTRREQVDLIPVLRAVNRAGISLALGEYIPLEAALEHPALEPFEAFKRICKETDNHPYVVLSDAEATVSRFAILLEWTLIE